MPSNTPQERLARRVARVMEREMICSEHGALCFIEAGRRDLAKARQFSEMDAMLFGEACGGDEIQQHAARRAFLGWNK